MKKMIKEEPASLCNELDNESEDKIIEWAPKLIYTYSQNENYDK